MRRRWSLALVAALALVAPARAEPAACPDAATEDPVAALWRAGRFLDAHHLALVLATVCAGSPQAPGWRLTGALALAELDETTRARAELLGLSRAGGPTGERARVALALLDVRLRDAQALEVSLARLPEEPRRRVGAAAVIGHREAFARQAAGLPAPLAAEALRAHDQFLETRAVRRPWLAGTLSALLPGAGQAYAGSLSGGAVAFVLNAALVGATVELARRDLPFTAGTAALAGSVFYVGNIVNAVDLAGRRNEAAAAPARATLLQLLVPEARP